MCDIYSRRYLPPGARSFWLAFGVGAFSDNPTESARGRSRRFSDNRYANTPIASTQAATTEKSCHDTREETSPISVSAYVECVGCQSMCKIVGGSKASNQSAAEDIPSSSK